jgi:hypothetical protein
MSQALQFDLVRDPVWNILPNCTRDPVIQGLVKDASKAGTIPVRHHLTRSQTARLTLSSSLIHDGEKKKGKGTHPMPNIAEPMIGTIQ